MADPMQLRRCTPIGNATAQLEPETRNLPRNSVRNTPRKPASLLEVLRNRQRNQGAIGSCTAPIATQQANQPEHPVQFAELVRAYGTRWGFLFDRETILAELDQADIAELESTETHHRQSWAQMLAHRLSVERMERGGRISANEEPNI